MLSREPVEREAPSFDVQADADAHARAGAGADGSHAGPATIETYTVFYARDGAVRDGVIVARTPRGERFLAHVAGDDADTIALLTDGAREPVGRAGQAVAGDDGLVVWRSA